MEKWRHIYTHAKHGYPQCGFERACTGRHDATAARCEKEWRMEERVMATHVEQEQTENMRTVNMTRRHEGRHRGADVDVDINTVGQLSGRKTWQSCMCYSSEIVKSEGI